MTRRQLLMSSPDATALFAQTFAKHLAPGDVILLSGGIGAGKTHFARSLIHALQDPPEDVPSPTFTLVQVYDTPKGEIWHSDLYRLSDPDECVELGLTDAFESAICLVEWPDKLEDLTPENALKIHLDTCASDDDHRQMTLHWTDTRWNLIEGLT